MPVVSGPYFSEAAYSYAGRGLTYQNYDCTHFTNLVRRTCGLSNLSQGSNAMWRSSAMLWKGTVAEARQKYGQLLPGMYMFHVIPDDDPAADPNHYGYGDGIGDVDHVAIYTGIGLGVMQSGGYGGSGVHDSPLRTSYLTLVACPTGIDYTGRVMPEIPNPAFYRLFYNSPDSYLGSTDTSDITDMQKQNANAVKSYFESQGWTLNSICGILGNMQYDSGINPAYIAEYNRNLLPDNAEDLTQLPNYVMQFFFGDYYQDPATGDYGLGLCQWSTTTTVNYLQQAYCVARGIVNHYNWYDGWGQCKRINSERASDMQGQSRFFDTVDVAGVRYSFANYATATAIPEALAEAWAKGYDRDETDMQYRKDNARYWYDYFTGPDAPDPITEPPVEPYTIPETPAWYYPTLYGKKKKGAIRKIWKI